MRAWLALGRMQEAEAAARRAEAPAAKLGLPRAVACAERARAQVALATNDGTLAAQCALSAAARLDEIGARIEAARSRTLAGRALLTVGERAEAAAPLEPAAAELHACGAVRFREEAERELRRLGRRFRRATDARRGDSDGLGTLSPRELEVAQLVKERKTNREIAAELFLSEKTVETHMRHIFGKLGVSLRVSVARAIEAGHVAER